MKGTYSPEDIARVCECLNRSPHAHWLVAEIIEEARQMGLIPPERRKAHTMITVDDRTPAQKQSHFWAVVARDKFMSGWGRASNGASRCAWACKSIEDAEQAEKWVRHRSEMRHVNIVDLRTYRAPRSTAHFHIYVCEGEHPALKGWVKL